MRLRSLVPLCLLAGVALRAVAAGQVVSSGEVRPFHEGKGAHIAEDPAALARLAALTGPASCVAGRAADLFACNGVDLVAFVGLRDLQAGAIAASNLWGFFDRDDGREYAVIGTSHGTAVVDVTDPAHPRVAGAVEGRPSPWREIKVYQRWNPARGRHDAYAYVVSEALGAGLQIIDLSDLPASVSLRATYGGFQTAHTVFVANADPVSGAAIPGEPPPVLYIQGSDQGFLALDISDPESPRIVGRFSESYVHDAWAGVFRGARASACAAGHDPCEVVVDWGGDAVRLIDFTEKWRPTLISELVYPGLGYAHSGWISRDGNYLFSFDEGDEFARGGFSRVRVLDIRNLATPSLAAEWTSSTNAIEHNGYTVGDRLYVSHYEHGLTVLDVATPTSPREIAFFDTFPAGEEAAFHGAWGVYPFLPSGTLLVSNIDGAGGLFVLREAALPGTPGPPRGSVQPVAPRSRATRRVPLAR